jgi:catechol 2,3-dioxygenase-like lactoylglutathione lyase family enzyme
MKPSTPSHPQLDPQTLGDHDGHVVYAMPMFLRLAARDPLRTIDFFTRVLDFDVMFRGPDAGGIPVLVHLRRAKYQDILVMPSRRPVQPGAALGVSFAVADADALDALAERIRGHAPDTLEGPADTPWNARELTVRDPDGNAFVFTARARTPTAGSVDDVMRSAQARR